MADIAATVDIEAPIDQVWATLTDLAGHRAWNPFLTSAEGVVAEGERLEVTLTLPGRKPQRFRPTVTAADAPHTFEWLGSVGMHGIFDGRHRFDLSETASGTRLVQSERFTGMLAPIIRPMIRARTIEGFEAMNDALRGRVEAGSPTDDVR